MKFLEKVSRGRIAGSIKLVVYGPPGSGKSTFASSAPSPVFIDFEGRTKHLDVVRFQPATWQETGAALKELVTGPGDFKTVVIDTLDHMEILIHKYLCEQGGVASLEDYDKGFGKGYVAAYNEMQRFLAIVEQLVAKNITVVMLAHAQLACVRNPVGEDYDLWKLKLKGGAKSDAAALVVEKADLVGFASFEDVVWKGKSDIRTKAKSTGNRILSFKHHPAYQTKCGVPMKKLEMPLVWGEFEAALDK